MIFQFWIRLKNEPLRGGYAVLDPNPKLKPFVNMQQSPNPQARCARAMRAQVFREIPPATQAGHKSCTSLLNPSLKPLTNPRFYWRIVFKNAISAAYKSAFAHFYVGWRFILLSQNKTFPTYKIKSLRDLIGQNPTIFKGNCGLKTHWINCGLIKFSSVNTSSHFSCVMSSCSVTTIWWIDFCWVKPSRTISEHFL